MNEGLSVLIAEDHPLFRRAIKSLLEGVSIIEMVYAAENGLVALEQIEQNHIDVLFLDINMPIMDGIECMRVIQAKYPELPVIVLTQHDSTGFFQTLSSLGARGYLLKSSKEEEIVHALKEVGLGGQHYVSANVKQEFRSLDDMQTPNLSDKEMEVLKLVCNHLKSHEIAEKLEISIHTVHTHRKNTLQKIGAQTNTQLIEWAIKNGILS
jgi:DNA-binding NarL/FixJ family response regulator